MDVLQFYYEYILVLDPTQQGSISANHVRYLGIFRLCCSRHTFVVHIQVNMNVWSYYFWLSTAVGTTPTTKKGRMHSHRDPA